MTFQDYLVEMGRGIVKSQIAAWGDNPKMVAYWKSILKTDSESKFIDEAECFISGRMYDDDCGFGAFLFDASDPRWTIVDGENNFPVVTLEEVNDHKRYDLDFFSSGYVPEGWNKDRSDVVWCCSVWDKKKNKRLDEWYYGYNLDTVVTVCWRLCVK